MKLKEVIGGLGLQVRTGDDRLEADVIRGYASDLMSDVIANSKEGDIWVTLQTHQNIVAVAVMKSLAGIILVNNREPENSTLEKAGAENVPIMVSDMPTFEIVGRLFGMGIKGL